MTEWRDISTAPRNGTTIWVIEPDSTGVHEAHWMDPCFWIAEAHDLWPSHPSQWHPFDKDRKPPHPYPDAERSRSTALQHHEFMGGDATDNDDAA